MANFRITVIGPDYREFLVSEIFHEQVQWVEISQETGELIIQFYNQEKTCVEFPLDDTLIALEAAKNDLLGGE